MLPIIVTTTYKLWYALNAFTVASHLIKNPLKTFFFFFQFHNNPTLIKMVLAKLYINRTQKTGRNFRSATLRRGRSLKTAGSSSFSLSIIASMIDEKSFTYKINRPTCHCHLKTNLEIVRGMQPIMNPKGTYFFQIQCPLGILTLLLTYEMVANRPAFQRVSGHKPRRHATGRWQLSFFFRTIHS